jgi:hypothetical protein
MRARRWSCCCGREKCETARIAAMGRPTRAGIAALVFGVLSLAFSALLAYEEYEMFHGGARFRTLLEKQIWITDGVLGALGLLGIVVGARSRRRNREEQNGA